MFSARRDYYEVLGVARDADAATIKNRFRELTLRYHPDRNKDPGAEERFKEIAEAYAILSDPKKRADYDARGFASVAGFSREDLFGDIDFGDIFGDLGGFGMGRGGGLFDGLFARGRPRRGADLHARIVVPLERIVTGGEHTVRFARRAACQPCKGTGAKAGTSPRKCEACGGTGRRVQMRNEQANVLFQQITACEECRGRGAFVDQPCGECNGRGIVERVESLQVKVPVGAEEGMRLRIPGHGEAAADPSLSAGDLYVVVHCAPDPRFERLGSDLWRVERLSLPDAVLGAELQVATLDGSATVKVPAGTQADQVLQLRGKGLPHFGREGRGDLNVRIQLAVPEKLSRKQRKLYQELRALER